MKSERDVAREAVAAAIKALDDGSEAVEHAGGDPLPKGAVDKIVAARMALDEALRQL